jgi:hypothetical protein
VEWYLNFFRPAGPDQFKGECCPAYLWDKSAAGGIHGFNPDMKIVMILRNPVERFFSAARYARQRGSLTSMDREAVLRKHKAFLLDRGAYYEQVKRYLDLFPQDQIRVYWFDDLRKDSRKLLLSLEEFIGAAPLIPDDIDQQQNVTAEPRSPALSRSMGALRRFTRKYHLSWLIELARVSGLAQVFTALRDQNKREEKTSRVSDLGDLDRRWLLDYYREDIDKLEELLGVDLDHWKDPVRTPHAEAHPQGQSR